jgi:peptidoglycan/LPS O-acetylase OafA/YrhL
VEEQFYLIFPFIVLVIAKKAKRAALLIATLFFGGMLLRGYLWLEVLKPLQHSSENFGSIYDEWIYYPTFSRLDGLIVGVSLAATRTFRPKIWTRLLENGYLALAVSISLLLLAAWLNGDKISFLPGSVFLYPVVALAFGSLLIPFVSPSCATSKVRVPGVATLATVSYGVYLVQKLVLHYFRENPGLLFGQSLFSALGFLSLFLACIVLAFALNLAIERPFLRLRDRLVTQSAD